MSNANYSSINKVLGFDYDHEVPDKLRSRAFAKAYRTYIRNKLKGTGLRLIPSNSSPYCESSGFITDDNGHFVYFSSGDYRYWGNDIYNRVLIRGAKDEKDYHGFTDEYCELCNIADKAQSIIQHYSKTYV